MKFILIFLLTLNFSCQLKTESNEVHKKRDDIPVPPPPKNIEKNNIIGFACYESGVMSDPVQVFSEFLYKKDYKILRKKLYSSIPAERYLATVLCEKLSTQNLIKITTKERNQIVNNKNNKEQVTICSGCTHRDELMLKELFMPEKNYCSVELEKWFQKVTN